MSQMTALVSKGDSEALLATRRIAIILFFLYMFKILFRFLSNYMAHTAAWKLVEELRQQVYDHIQSFSLEYYREHQTGDLMSRVVNDTGTFELLFAHIIPDIVTHSVTVVGVCSLLLSINVSLALITIVPIPFIAACSIYFSGKTRPLQRNTQRSLASINAKLQDNFSGIVEIQAFGQQTKESGHVGERLSLFTTNMLKALKYGAVFNPTIEFLTSLGSVAVVGLGGYLAYLGQIDVAQIVGFMLYLSLFYTPVAGAARLLEDYNQALAGTERVMEILDTPIGIKDKEGSYELGATTGKIEFDKVCFSYNSESTVLDGVSFTANPGQFIALVGPTGVGKTTTVQLISRFYEPTSGTVKIDGHDINNVKLASLRSQISLVLQDTFLFNGTIAENISYANNDAQEEDIVKAAKIARIHDDVMSMPDGYGTQIGERGAKLSGGQKQRIAIARAVLRDTPILILDEATASVDTQTEREIQSAINDLAGTRTIIAIAHRLSTIKHADKILVFEEGKIVEEGIHEELIAQGNLYSRLNSVSQETL